MYKKAIIDLGARLYNKNLTIGTSGNLSIRTKDGILITATGTSLGRLGIKDIVLTDFNGKEFESRKASSEKMLHVEIYKERPDVNVIIHTHSTYLTSFACCHKSLKEPIMSENILYFEEIPVAEYAMPSSKELAINTAKYLKDKDVVMMANHGVIVVAEDIEKAFAKIETAEYYAHVTLNTMLIGGAKPLSEKDVQDLIALKKS